MTCTRCQHQSGHLRSTSCCWKICSPTAGIKLHTGKTRTWNRATEMEELGDEVWNLPGMKILGTPVGSEEFHLASRERGWLKKKWCGEPHRGCKTTNALDSSWSSAPFTISCAPCLSAPRQCTRKAMTGGCLLEGQPTESGTSWPHCPCDWEDWVLVQR